MRQAGNAPRPLNEIDRDPAREALDEAFLVDILGLPAMLVATNGALALLRRKLAREPSINGGKRKF